MKTADKTGKTYISTRAWIVGIAVFFAVCVVGTVLLLVQKPGTVANVYRDNECIYSVDLSLVTEGFEKTFTDENGHSNTIRVENGRIRMIAADCPDKVCVDTGWIGNGAVPIVCLPHHLVLRIEKQPQNDIDSVAR